MADPSASNQPATVGRRDERLGSTSADEPIPRDRAAETTAAAASGVFAEATASGALTDDERARLRERYEEVASLAGGLAHEIRNPLSTIGMLLELMSEDLTEAASPRDRRLANRLQTVQSECQRLENILNAFLQFARVGELTLAESDLNQLTRGFIDFYKPDALEHRIEISPHLASDLPSVRVDPSLFRQMLLNLARNAQQAMPGGGLIELQTRLVDGRVQLAIIDNGAGMDEATRAKLFQTFFSTKTSGSGLGLATVRKIVDAHHGTITCDSEPGRGTRFLISFPPATS
jgi:two-component system, NtrC family, sensor histidine kinase HydH